MGAMLGIRNHERRFLMHTRNFHLGDILSITTKKLVSPRHIDGVYDILDFMTGDNLMTHQLPRAGEEMTPVLLRQHPQLRDVDASSVNGATWKDWMDAQIATFGETLPVSPAHQFHEVRDPIEEAEQRFGRDRAVVAWPHGDDR
jgi:hypothetical protein